MVIKIHMAAINAHVSIKPPGLATLVFKMAINNMY